MVSTVKTRPNHYEMLGLKPTASRDEIDDAFARAMRRPHLMTEVAEIGIAFDTLRSASKRRAYDETLGLRREPEPRPAPPAMSFRVSARLAAIASTEPAALHPQPPAPIADPVPYLKPAPQSPPESLFEMLRGAADADFAPHKLAREDRKERAGEWRYPALGLGAVLLGVVLVAAWAGAHAQDSAGAGAPATALSVKHRAAVVAPSDAVPVPQAVAESAVPPAESPTRRAHSRRAPASGSRLAGIDQTLAKPPPGEAGSDQVPDAPAQAAAVPAALPLSGAVIARTIDRIGYACGSVASAAPAGEPGAYKITCSSGQSYQAKPVHGRYRFRRW